MSIYFFVSTDPGTSNDIQGNHHRYIQIPTNTKEKINIQKIILAIDCNNSRMD